MTRKKSKSKIVQPAFFLPFGPTILVRPDGKAQVFVPTGEVIHVPGGASAPGKEKKTCR